MKPFGNLFGLLTLFLSSSAYAAENHGQNWQINFFDAATQIMEKTTWFHHYILLPIIVLITLFVFALMVWLVLRYRESKNPTPSKVTHNVPLEIAWTLIPVMILMVVAVFSIDLLHYQDKEPKADVTIKAIGYQWYWGYEYPMDEVAEYSTYMQCPPTGGKAQGFDEKCLAELKEKNIPHKLATDYPVVVPVGKNIRVLITASDVIHSWTIPAFGVKKDAVPGRMNSIWFNAEKLGTFYGQCSELCGVNHAFMPITVKVVPENIYKAWLASAKEGDLDKGNRILNAYEKGESQQATVPIKDSPKAFMSFSVNGQKYEKNDANESPKEIQNKDKKIGETDEAPKAFMSLTVDGKPTAVEIKNNSKTIELEQKEAN